MIAPIRTWCPQEPNLKQRTFLSLKPDDNTSTLEALFGGSAGPGKSSALLMAALQFVHVPGYSALILRKDSARLRLAGGLIPRSKEWLYKHFDKGVHWKDQDRMWVFEHENGNAAPATIQFGYLDTKDDKYRYGSSEYQCVCWDELTEFPEEDYLFLFSRQRMTEAIRSKGVFYRMISASNPGGRYGEWVKNRFITEQAEDDRKLGQLKNVYWKDAA